MPRSRALFTAPIVLAIILIGVFAIRSRGDNNANVETTPTKNCPPIARADAVATKPATPLAIDVLANDTDPDGDPLVFQIRNTTGGESTIDDGGTPTDASDDRVMFTPADPAPPQATIDYQALDPDGALSESTVTVTINADGVLPAGAASEAVPTNGKSPSSNGCGTGRVSTSTTGHSGTTGLTSTGSTARDHNSNSKSPTAKKKSSAKKG
ncbi:MAG: large repetitive protein, partial [Actinomycetota bacterium]